MPSAPRWGRDVPFPGAQSSHTLLPSPGHRGGFPSSLLRSFPPEIPPCRTLGARCTINWCFFGERQGYLAILLGQCRCNAFALRHHTKKPWMHFKISVIQGLALQIYIYIYRSVHSYLQVHTVLVNAQFGQAWCRAEVWWCSREAHKIHDEWENCLKYGEKKKVWPELCHGLKAGIQRLCLKHKQKTKNKKQLTIQNRNKTQKNQPPKQRF